MLNFFFQIAVKIFVIPGAAAHRQGGFPAKRAEQKMNLAAVTDSVGFRSALNPKLTRLLQSDTINR
jgi:hypothetical protein